MVLTSCPDGKRPAGRIRARRPLVYSVSSADKGQAAISWLSSAWAISTLRTSILRGFACSVTGIRTSRTPLA